MAILIPKKNTRAAQFKRQDDREAQARRFRQRKAWFVTEMMRQQANRYQMALDEAYYDGDQWTPDEAATVRARGQNPVVFNEVAPMVDFLLGTERRTRVDFTIQNRTDDSEEAFQDATNKMHLLKFVDDLNRTQFVRSDVADDKLKAGLGWLEIGVRADPTDYPIYKRRESWRNMLHDSLGASKMPEDWRYIFRFRETDFDIAEALIPADQREKVDLLRRAVINADTRAHMDWLNGGPMTSLGLNSMMGDAALMDKWTTYDAEAWLDNPRERVLLIECWATEVARPGEGPTTTGEGFGIEDRMRMLKRASIMTEFDTLFESWSPFTHDMYPFIPDWCYRNKRTGLPYSVIRRHRGPQDSLNKHMSKAQFRISTRQILLETDALDDEVMDEDELADRAGDPSAVMVFKKGALSGKKVEIREGAQMAAADIELADRFAQSIRSNGPVSTEARGQENSNTVSGKARAIREEQSGRLVAELFDNSLLMRQWEGEITLSLCEQYHIEPIVFPKQGDGGRAEYVRLNQPDPKNPGQIINDVQKRKAAFVIGEAPWQQSLAEASFEALMSMLGELAKVAPQVVVNILDVVFEMNPSLPKKHLILRRIRQTTGMDDPNEGDTPEAQARRAEKAAIAKAQMQAQLAQLQAEVAEAQAKGEKLNAEAMSKRLEALYMAAQAAQVLTMAPEIAPVADELAASVGFKDKHGDPVIGAPVPTVAAPAVPPAQQTDGALAGGMAGSESPELTGVNPGVK